MRAPEEADDYAGAVIPEVWAQVGTPACASAGLAPRRLGRWSSDPPRHQRLVASRHASTSLASLIVVDDDHAQGLIR